MKSEAAVLKSFLSLDCFPWVKNDENIFILKLSLKKIDFYYFKSSRGDPFKSP